MGKADVNSLDGENFTPLHYICFSKISSQMKENVIKLLIDRGANVNLLSKNGKNALFVYLENLPDHEYYVSKMDLEIVKLLVPQDINQRDIDGWTCLDMVLIIHKKITLIGKCKRINQCL